MARQFLNPRPQRLSDFEVACCVAIAAALCVGAIGFEQVAGWTVVAIAALIVLWFAFTVLESAALLIAGTLSSLTLENIAWLALAIVAGITLWNLGEILLSWDLILARLERTISELFG